MSKRRRLRLLDGRRKRLPGRGMKLQVLRRALQSFVLLLLIAIPVLSIYANLAKQNDETGIMARPDTALIAELIGDDEEAAELTGMVRGSVWTMKIGETVISDPLAVVDFVAATGKPIDAFVLTAAIPLLLSLLLGRVFCGWICPADLLFELTSTVRRWIGIETNVTFPLQLKYVILALGFAVGAAAGIQVFAEIYPPRVLSGELYLWLTYGALGAGAWLLLAVVGFELFVSRRFFCRYVCPGGALYSLLGRYRIVRLKVVAAACTDCDKCQPVCEFGLDPSKGRLGQECNNCGLCVRACGPRALEWRLGFRPKDGRDVISDDRPSEHAAALPGATAGSRRAKRLHGGQRS